LHLAHVNHKRSTDDFPSKLCAIGGWSVFIIQSKYGLGRHQDTILPEDLKKFQHAAFWQSIVSAAFALMFLKVSIGLSLLRLGFKLWYRWALYAVICAFATPIRRDLETNQLLCKVANVCVGISGALIFMLFCQPMAGFWDKSLKPSCASISVMVNGGLANTSRLSPGSLVSSAAALTLCSQSHKHHHRCLARDTPYSCGLVAPNGHPNPNFRYCDFESRLRVSLASIATTSPLV
jgi:hypothetical protein